MASRPSLPNSHPNKPRKKSYRLRKPYDRYEFESDRVLTKKANEHVPGSRESSQGIIVAQIHAYRDRLFGVGGEKAVSPEQFLAILNGRRKVWLVVLDDYSESPVNQYYFVNEADLADGDLGEYGSIKGVYLNNQDARKAAGSK